MKKHTAKKIVTLTALIAPMLYLSGCSNTANTSSEAEGNTVDIIATKKESDLAAPVASQPRVTGQVASDQMVMEQMAMPRSKAMVGMGYMPPQPHTREQYAPIEENERKQVSKDPVSTFSIDVDTAAYANVRRFINNGQLPPNDAVRIEEMINYFDYQYPTPEAGKHPFNIVSEIAPTPWSTNSYLLHVGVKGYQPVTESQPARNLVFLLDVSGSMNAPNKLELLKKSLRLLVNQMSARDRVAIVVYAGASGVVLESTPGNHRSTIINALDNLHAGGSTNGGAGIELAYAIAQQHQIENGVNRVILATDGDFNVGLSNTGDLTNLIKEKKRSGIGLTVLGFGMGNYNDYMLEAISNSGDGNAAYIDTLQEAQKVLVNDINATLHTIAKDTKIQVEFNPDIVASYRLIGYENRILNREDFTNDRVDAGDVGAGHTVTALYEITLNQPTRYQHQHQEMSLPYNNELGYLKLRYKRPDQDSSIEMVHVINQSAVKRDIAATSDNFRFSAAVAGFGQLLRRSPNIGDYSFDEVLNLARGSRGEDKFGYRSEFINLVGLAQSLR